MREIFNPFQQVGDQRLKSEGTGLGLTISQRIAEKMGSHLYVSSTPGQGSVFWFEVILPKVADGSTLVNTSGSTPAIVGFKGQTYKILLVDDEKLHREMYSDYLTKHGFDVTCESNAVSALEKLSKKRFDLLVTDIMMAGMNGLELIKTIREDMKISEVKLPIIVVSAFFDSSSKEWETYKYKGNAYSEPVAIVQVHDNGTIHYTDGNITDTINIQNVHPYKQ